MFALLAALIIAAAVGLSARHLGAKLDHLAGMYPVSPGGGLEPQFINLDDAFARLAQEEPDGELVFDPEELSVE